MFAKWVHNWIFLSQHSPMGAYQLYVIRAKGRLRTPCSTAGVVSQSTAGLAALRTYLWQEFEFEKVPSVIRNHPHAFDQVPSVHSTYHVSPWVDYSFIQQWPSTCECGLACLTVCSHGESSFVLCSIKDMSVFCMVRCDKESVGSWIGLAGMKWGSRRNVNHGGYNYQYRKSHFKYSICVFTDLQMFWKTSCGFIFSIWIKRPF